MPNPAVDSSVKKQPHCRRHFYHRFLLALALSASLIGFSLGLGIFGYHFIAGLNWVDAMLNAAMILTGMGPVDSMSSTAGKLFATFYALYSGIAFLTMMAVVLAPLIHRLLHKFHLDEDEQEAT